jgi:hypothetical protein
MQLHAPHASTHSCSLKLVRAARMQDGILELCEFLAAGGSLVAIPYRNHQSKQSKQGKRVERTRERRIYFWVGPCWGCGEVGGCWRRVDALRALRTGVQRLRGDAGSCRWLPQWRRGRPVPPPPLAARGPCQRMSGTSPLPPAVQHGPPSVRHGIGSWSER